MQESREIEQAAHGEASLAAVRPRVPRDLALADKDDPEGLQRLVAMLEEVAVEKAPLPAIEETRRRLRAGLALRGSLTVGEWLDQWFAAKKRRKTTLNGYASHIHVPIAEAPQQTAETAEGPPVETTWRRVDLGPVLDGTYTPPAPTIGRHDDGAGMFYPGRLHSIYAEPEAMKTWLALTVAVGELARGNAVTSPTGPADDGRATHQERTTTMTEPLISKEQACANARAVLDAARARRDLDRAAGRLPAEVEAILQRLEREQHERKTVRREAIRAAARIWRHGLDAMDRMSVTDAARACYTPGGPSLAELEQRITADRAARTIHHRATDRPEDDSGDGTSATGR